LIPNASRLNLVEIVSFTLPTNKRSRSMMEKVGFRNEKNVEWANLPHVLCRIPK
jgi:hypothetical protein